MIKSTKLFTNHSGLLEIYNKNRFKSLHCLNYYKNHNIISRKEIKNVRKIVNKIQSRFVHGNPGGVNENVENDVETFKIFKKILPFMWPKNRWDLKRRVILSFVFLIIAKIMNVLIPYFFKIVVDSVTDYQKIKDYEWKKIAKMTIIAFILGYGAARLGSAFFNEIKNAIFAKVAQDSIRRISIDSFKFVQDLDLSFHLGRRTGMISKSIDRGTRGISFTLSALFFNLLPTSFEILLVTSLMGFYFGAPFAFTTLGCVSSYGFYTYLITKWRTKYRIIMNVTDNEAGSRAVDSLINYETVKYFNNENYEANSYDEILKKYEGAALKTTSSLASLNFGQNAIFSMGLVAIMLLASQGVFIDTMTVGDLVFVNGLLFQLSIPLNFLGSTYRDIRQSLVDLQSLFNLLKTDKSITTQPNATDLIWPENIKIGDPLIKFENVTFSYSPNHPILKNLSFTVPYGKKIAIVGGSGSGKSTIVRLLYRFFDPEEGKILICEQDIKTLNLDSFRKKIAVVPQDQVLFHNTILHNIHYGNLNSTIDEIHRVSKISGLHDTIKRFPNGYNTQVGERGLKLSGGEKQRVAIARAILKNCPILIYDEATSSLDSITEKKILRVLNKVLSERTSVVIAHRLSTIVDADEILVIENGSIVEKGRHTELLINNPLGPYSRLWTKQNEITSNDEPKIAEKNISLDDVLEFNDGCPKEGCCSK